MPRYWFDSFPGIDLSAAVHPVLDFYKTPYGGPENGQHSCWDLGGMIDNIIDEHAPYTTVSQNRGGPS